MPLAPYVKPPSRLPTILAELNLRHLDSGAEASLGILIGTTDSIEIECQLSKCTKIA